MVVVGSGVMAEPSSSEEQPLADEDRAGEDGLNPISPRGREGTTPDAEHDATDGRRVAHEPHLARPGAKDGAARAVLDDPQRQLARAAAADPDYQSEKLRADDGERGRGGSPDGGDQPENVEAVIILRVGLNAVTENQIEDVGRHGQFLPERRWLAQAGYASRFRRPSAAGLAANADFARKLDALEKKSDAQFRVVFDAIRKLVTPPPDPAPRRIGFRAGP
jgi:hypothetical protein